MKKQSLSRECWQVRELLALRSEEWRAEERRQVAAHLASCPDCATLARDYAEQDRLLRDMPRVRLTPAQRDQLWTRINQDRRRQDMAMRFSTVVGAAMVIATLVVLALGFNMLLREDASPATDLPVGTLTSAERALWQWLDAAQDKDMARQTLTVLQRQPWWEGEVILFTYEDRSLQADKDTRQQVLSWVLVEPEPAGGGWTVVLAGDPTVTRWPLGSMPDYFWISEGKQGAQGRAMSVIYGLWFGRDQIPEALQLTRGDQEIVVPLHNGSFLYVSEGGLVAERPGLLWACDHPEQEWCRVSIWTDAPSPTPEPLIFAGEIRSDELAVDPLTGQQIPFTVGERDLMDLTAPGRLSPPIEVGFTLGWQVVAPPSADWQVFVHLVNEQGQLVLQSDVGVDWPAQPCAEDAYDPECLTSSEHTWYFPEYLETGLYTITVGLYDPTSGQRAPVTSPAGVTYPAVLGQVSIVSD